MNKSKGFTLVELIIVVAIVGIVALIAIGVIGGGSSNFELLCGNRNTPACKAANAIQHGYNRGPDLITQ